MSDCLFCKIIKGDIPSEKVFENETIFGFKDISALAKKHYLFIHKQHTKNINEMTSTQPEQLKDVFSAIHEFTNNAQLEKDGFRIVTNVNANGGQTIFHTHFHVLGGEQLRGFGA